jgi:hypothetical protein
MKLNVKKSQRENDLDGDDRWNSFGCAWLGFGNGLIGP